MTNNTLEKQINILDYSLSSLWRRKMKNFSVMLVFTAVIFLLASFQMVNQSLIQAASKALAKAPEITVQRLVAGRQEGMPVSYTEKLSTILGIKKSVPRVWGYYFDESNLANYTVMGMNTNEMPLGSMLNLSLENGRFPGNSDSTGVVLGRSINKILNMENRSIFSLFRTDLTLKPLKVLGVFSHETDLLTNDLIVMSEAAARDLFGIEDDIITDLAVYVTNPLEIETIAKKITKALPGVRVLTRPQIQKTYKVVFGWRSGFASICLLTALFAFVILAWDKASGLSPEEKREISILKILGWETSDILIIRFWESFWVSGIAFISGCILAFIHVTFFEASLFRPIMIGWSVISPPFRLLPDIAFSDLLLIFCFSVMPYLAATIIPAWKSATVPVDSAMR